MKRTMNRFISVAVSAALATSLFGAPTMAFATGDEGSSTTFVEEPSEVPASDVIALDEDGAPIGSGGTEETAGKETGSKEAGSETSAEDAANAASDTTDAQESDAIVVEGEQASAESGSLVLSEGSNTTSADTRSGSGMISVRVNYLFPYLVEDAAANPLTFQVTLKDEALQQQTTQTVTLEGSDADYTGLVDFNAAGTASLTEGSTYALTIAGTKFVSYEHQQIAYEGGTMSLEVYAGGGIDLARAGEGPKPGVMQAGNLKSDDGTAQVVDAADVRQIINRLEAEHKTDEDYSKVDADLNADGVVDLMDFQLMAEFYRVAASQADPFTQKDASLAFEAAKGYVEQTGDNSFNMTGENGEAISPDNPVEVSADLAETDQTAVQAEGATLSSPAAKNAEGHALEGSYTVEGFEVGAGNKVDTSKPIRETYEISTAGPVAAAQPAGTVGAAVQAPRALGGALQVGDVQLAARALSEPAEAAHAVTISDDGTITINFGRRIAIKTVTLTFTKAQVRDEETGQISANLAEISDVTFLNHMDQLVVEPENTTTELISLTPGNRQFTAVWKHQTNVTGYELLVSDGTNSQVYAVGNTAGGNVSKTIDAFVKGPKGKLENNKTYTVQVRLTNGAWRGEYSAPMSVVPKADKAPDKVEKVNVSGGYRTFKVSWGTAKDADSYNLYYREGNNSYTKISGIESLNYTVSGLPDRAATYTLYLTASNEIGEGPSSGECSVDTTTLTAVDMPNYKLLNTKGADGRYTTGIAGAKFVASNPVVEDPNGVNTGGNNAMCLFDNDFKSSVQINDWDLGVSYHPDWGVDVTFDGQKTVGMISFAASAENISYSGVKVYYKASKSDKNWQSMNATIMNRAANDNRQYTLIKLDRGVQAEEMLIGLTRYVRLINIAEMRFHGYNDVEERIAGMYSNEGELASLRIKLADTVQTTANSVADTFHKEAATGERSFDDLIGLFRTELNEVKDNGELYPFQSAALTELKYIETLLSDEAKGMKDVVKIHTDLADAYDNGKNLGISGLNAWQPLGVSVTAGETITVYSGAPGVTSGVSKVDLYVGQYEGESNQAPRRIGTFRIGRTANMTVPTDCFSSKDSKEKGGQMYAVYTGSNANDRFYVRVLGGDKLARLDLMNAEANGIDRDAAIKQYVTDLKAQVEGLTDAHARQANGKQVHANAGDLNHTCVAGATDVMLDKMMYSVPAKTVYDALSLGSASVDAAAAKLATGVDGSNQMMELFYQHKGLTDDAPDLTNKAPNRHLNIRYMEMFSGAFMYAAGNHIGVQYGNTAAFASMRPFDENGKGGNYLGWGSAHEIGHNINDGRYAYAEVTNNYFAQLCKTMNAGSAASADALNSSYTRFKYNNVYNQVTSGAEAHTGNVFTQLAMYWQLMLAYDADGPSKLYDSYSDLAAKRFFAKVDAYARNSHSFTPEEGGQALTLSTEKQNIIRLASAAARKDLTAFFEAWGFHADATTLQFVEQFSDEGRALQYINDDLAVSKGAFASISGTGIASAVAAGNGSQVTLTITPDGQKASTHGYEITRVRYEMGNEIRQVVAFVPVDSADSYSFTDDAAALGNRVVRYQVQAVGKNLERATAVPATTADGTGQIVLDGMGLYKTDGWSVSTNMSSAADKDDVIAGSSTVQDGDSYACSGLDEEYGETGAPEQTVRAIDRVLNADEVYSGTAADADPYVMIDMQSVKAVQNLVYKPGTARNLTDFKVEVSQDGSEWFEVAASTDSSKLDYNAEGDTAKIFFPQRVTATGTRDYINTENARYVKLTAVGKAGAAWDIKQVQIYGPSGDKIELTQEYGPEGNKIPAAGKLKADFVLEKDANGTVTSKIPAGSIVFIGTFQGNPAYSNVILFGTKADGSTMIVGGTAKNEAGEEVLRAKQAILAPNPEGFAIGETSHGSWIYWIENADDLETGMSVRAELYRTDNAFTNEGQRLTSDSLAITLGDVTNLPEVELTSENVDDGQINETHAL